jgi:uncharacterized membrane protein YccC
LLLSLVGLPEVSAAGQRAVDTVVGGTLALVAFVAWPTWEALAIRGQLARLLEAQGAYAAAVLRCCADPAHRDKAALDTARSAARRARTSAESSLDRLRSEPTRRVTVDVEATVDLVAAVRRLAVTSLALHADLAEAAPVPPSAVRRLADGVDTALRTAARGVGGSDTQGGSDDDGAATNLDLHAAAEAFASAAGQPVLARDARQMSDVVTELTDRAAALAASDVVERRRRR